MKIHNNETIFKTSDLTLATTLSLNSPIIFVDRSNMKRVFFMFKVSRELTALIEKYWLGEITVEPQTFFNQVKNLKNRIYGS